jgi:hypothetical protein
MLRTVVKISVSRRWLNDLYDETHQTAFGPKEGCIGKLYLNFVKGAGP